MPENKKQHFVPQSVLKLFAADDRRRQINLVNIKRAKVIRGASLRDQCYRNYLYGETTVIEKMLARLEGLFAAITRQMIETNAIEHRQGLHLVMMVALQRGRTERAEERVNAQATKLMRIFMHGQVTEETLRNARLRAKDAASSNVGQSLALCPLTLDLRRFLVVNRTDTPFIISDNPVVSTNWYARARYRKGPLAGIVHSGLQMLLPLSPRHALLMHDGYVYTTSGTNDVLQIHDPKGVDALNELQWLNANKNIYFPPGWDDTKIASLMQLPRDEEDFDFQRLDATERPGFFRGTDKDEFQPPTPGVTRELIHIGARALAKDIRIKGVTLRSHPKVHDDKSMAGPLRDPVWRQIVEEFADGVLEQRRSFNDFWQYVLCHPRALEIGTWFEREKRRSEREASLTATE